MDEDRAPGETESEREAGSSPTDESDDRPTDVDGGGAGPGVDRRPGGTDEPAEERRGGEAPDSPQKGTPSTDTTDGEEDVTPAEGPDGGTDRSQDAESDAGDPAGAGEPAAEGPADDDVPADVRSYDRFQKVDRASYDRVNEFLRDRTYITAREWAIARLCADFRTATGVEMTKIGENLPHLVPFMTDTYSPQAVNQARSAFEEKVRMAGATFLYGAMSGFFTADELDDLMYEVTEVAKFLLEVEGVELTVEEELDAEDRISAVMREVRQASEELRYDEVACPHCGQAFQPEVDD